MFRATNFVEKRRKYAANLAVLKTYNFAPIHSNMCGRVGLGYRHHPLALTPMTQPHGRSATMILCK